MYQMRGKSAMLPPRGYCSVAVKANSTLFTERAVFLDILNLVTHVVGGHVAFIVCSL